MRCAVRCAVLAAVATSVSGQSSLDLSHAASQAGHARCAPLGLLHSLGGQPKMWAANAWSRLSKFDFGCTLRGLEVTLETSNDQSEFTLEHSGAVTRFQYGISCGKFGEDWGEWKKRLMNNFRELGFRGHRFKAHYEAVGYFRGQGRVWKQRDSEKGKICTVVVPLHSIDGTSIRSDAPPKVKLVVMVGAVTTLTGALLVLVVAPVLSHLDLLWYLIFTAIGPAAVSWFVLWPQLQFLSTRNAMVTLGLAGALTSLCIEIEMRRHLQDWLQYVTQAYALVLVGGQFAFDPELSVLAVFAVILLYGLLCLCFPGDAMGPLSPNFPKLEALIKRREYISDAEFHRSGKANATDEVRKLMKSGDWAKFMEGKDPTNYDNVHESDLEEDDEPGCMLSFWILAALAALAAVAVALLWADLRTH